LLWGIPARPCQIKAAGDPRLATRGIRSTIEIIIGIGVKGVLPHVWFYYSTCKFPEQLPLML
jgi:hypothetical protein